MLPEHSHRTKSIDLKADFAVLMEDKSKEAAVAKQNVSRRDLLLKVVPGLRSTPEPAKSDKPPMELKLGLEAFEKEDWAEAVAHLRPYIKGNQEDVENRQLLGYALYRLDQRPQARVEFERVLKLRPGDKFAALYLGLVLLKMDKQEKAVKAWKEYMEPEDAIQKELQTQLAKLDGGDAEAIPGIIDSVEAAVEKRKDDLLKG